MRILGKGQVQQQAFKELSDLPKDDRLRKNILELVGILSELGDLSNLQELWLQNNSLNGTLPSEYGSLSNLQVLYLYNNDLSGTLPSEYGSLSNLQYLYLQNNSLNGTLRRCSPGLFDRYCRGAICSGINCDSVYT
ncbi:MAG: leucine-rich repeat domain-containing protein [Hormoscilla sp. SP5CHS1]|nr:leucine-rich repeat domain-containing protein [Hormoscilla sp. SP12CHS1]MBC6452876.1 leucine-rich repeat domain-containing protein [Hormoscilla sp. SP5CHS1]